MFISKSFAREVLAASGLTRIELGVLFDVNARTVDRWRAGEGLTGFRLDQLDNLRRLLAERVAMSDPPSLLSQVARVREVTTGGILGPTENLKPVNAGLKQRVTAPPKGWAPGVAWDGSEGVGTSEARPATEGEPDHAALLTEWGFDPKLFMIEGALSFSRWQQRDGGPWLKAYRGKIVRRPDIEHSAMKDLVRHIRAVKPKPNRPSGNLGMVVILSDWQIGKVDMHGGTDTTIERVRQIISGVVARTAELRKIGRDVGDLYILGLGDLIERCGGFYPSQTFMTDLTEEEQREVALHLIIECIRTWAPLFNRVVVASVPGNHGENRGPGGKAFTHAVRDNADTGVFRLAAIALAQVEAFEHVVFVLPKDRATFALDVAGLGIGLAHGHQFGPAGVLKWWAEQTLGEQPVAGAQMLVTGHYHHLKVEQMGPRTHVQVPAMDPGSQWFAERRGMDSPPGMVTFTASPVGWDDLAVIEPTRPEGES